MIQWKHGALVAMAAGALLSSACKKQEKAAPEPAGEAVKADPGTPAAAPAAAAPAPAAGGEQMAKVHCMGVNSCKGTSACKTASNACSGQNGCKGQGFLELTETDCKAQGGTVAAK